MMDSRVNRLLFLVLFTSIYYTNADRAFRKLIRRFNKLENSFKRDIFILKSEISMWKSTVNKITKECEKDIKTFQFDIRDLTIELKEQKFRSAELEKQVNATVSILSEAEESLDSRDILQFDVVKTLEDKIQEQRKVIEEADKALKEEKSQRLLLKARVETLTTSLESLRDKIKSENVALNEIKQQKQNWVNISNIFQTRIESLEKSMQKLNNQGTWQVLQSLKFALHAEKAYCRNRTMQIEKEQAFLKQYINNEVTKSSKITKETIENMYALQANVADVGKFVRKMENRLVQLNVTLTGSELKISEIERHSDPIAGCPALEITNAVVRPASSVSHGSTVTVECEDPYFVIGNPKPSCNNGTFEDVPFCDLGCQAYRITNAIVRPDTSISNGSTVTVKCKEQYSVIGNPTPRCCNGIFEDVPFCALDCQALRITNAVVTPDTSVSHGTTVTVECKDHYSVIGNPMTSCYNGTFENIPFCGFDVTGMRAVSQSRVNIKLTNENGWPIHSEFLPDGRLILCDSNNKKIKLLSTTFTLEDSIQFTEDPWDLAVINSTTVVTFSSNRWLQFLHVVPNLQLGASIHLDWACYGIDALNDTLYLTCRGSVTGYVRLLDFEGNSKGTVGADLRFMGPHCITVSPVSRKIFISNFLNQAIMCVSADLKHVFNYTHSSLGRPYNILLDDLDNIVVSDPDNRNILIIDSSGKRQRNLLALPGYFDPFALAYRRSDGTLVVSGRQDDLFVFKLTNQK